MKRKFKQILSALLTICLAGTCVFASFDFSGTTSVYAKKTVKQYKGTKQQINSKLAAIQRQKNAVKGSLSKSKEYLNLLNSLENSKNKEYVEMRNILYDMQEEERQMQKQIDLAKVEYKNKMNLLKARIKAAYENSTYTYLYTLMNSDGILDFTYRSEMISKIVKNDQKILSEAIAAQKDLEIKLKLQAQERIDVQKKVDSIKSRIADLNASQRDAAVKVEKATASLEELEKRETQLEAESRRIDQMIEDLLKEGDNNSGNYTGGSMFYPVNKPKIVTSPFGYRIHPITKKRTFHAGVDLAGHLGTPIYAAEDGKVISAGWQNGYGNTIILSHGNSITTLYAHASAILVSVGDHVKRGQRIGKVGSTGWSTGPHLHFEVRRGSTKLNPQSGYI